MKTNKPTLIPEHKNSPTITTCWCNSPYHCVYWFKERDDDGNTTLAFSLFVNPLVGFWQRVKNAIKYIFQIGSLEFDEWRISNESFEDFVKLVDDIKDDRRIDNIDKPESKEEKKKRIENGLEWFNKKFKSNNQNETNNDDVKLVDEIPEHLSNAIMASNEHFNEIIKNEKIISKYYSDKGEDRPYPLTKYEAMKYVDYIDGAIDVDIATRDSFRKCIDKKSDPTEYIKYKDIIRLWGSFKNFKNDFTA